MTRKISSTIAALVLALSGIFTMAGVASADPPTACGFWKSPDTGKVYVINCAYAYVKYKIYYATGGPEERCLSPKEWYQPQTWQAAYAADKLGAC